MSRANLMRQRPQKITYFKKEFKLMIHNITLQQEVRSTFYTLQCANYTSIPNAIFNISINQTVEITTIDITSNQQQKADLEVTLDLSHFAKGIKNDLALVKFMVNKQKILAASSVNFYTQPLANRKGTIQYKFVSQKTTQIFQDQVEKFNLRRDQVVKIQAQLAQNPQLKRLVQILDSKDDIIKTLQRKIASLIEQTRKLSNIIQRQHSQQRRKLKQGLNLNLNINATNNFHMKKLNEKLTEENTYLHKRIETVEQEMQQTQKKFMEMKLENNIMQIQLGKRDILDQPMVTVTHPSRTTIIDQTSRRDQLQRIAEQEYDQELEKKSKMADSLFLANNPNQNPNMMTTFGAGDESFVKSRAGGSSRRPNQSTMVIDKSAATLLLNSNVSPRAMKDRSKSLVDPQFANLQQQMQQSRVYDQEQVMMELNELKDLKENLQQRKLESIPQQDGTLRYPKLQAAIKSSYRMIERLNDQKILLQQKVRRRDEQVEYLRRQLQKSKMNFKNFEKQLRERSSNAKDQFETRMAAIKMETQMKMADMRKQNRFSDYEFVMQQQKRQIQLQKMRYENQSLRQKYEQAVSELRSIQAQKSTQMSKFKNTQTAINKQKQMYKSKFYEMQDSFTKQQQQLSITKQKAKQYQTHLMRIQQLEHIEQQLRKKIQTNQKANNQLIKKCKRYQDKFAEIQPKWTVYRQMENQFDVMKRKIINLQKLNQRFQTRMEEMKKFALKLENAYYQKKSKNQTDKQFDQAYQKQLQQRIEQTYKKLRFYQKEFYQDQQHQLNQTKKQLIQFYYKKIVQENQRIDEALNYNQQERQMFKNQKEHQINIIKENKLEDIDKQIKKYQIALVKLLNSEEYMPKGLNEKVSFLQQKLRKFQIGQFGAGTISQSSQCQLKNTIDRLNDSIKDRQSQINELKKTVGKMSDGGNLLKVSNIQTTFANQRKSMIEEMAKSREIFSRSFEDLKKANAELLKQKSALQIELQNYKFREQKLILKNTQRQRELQRVSKKSTDDFKRKVNDLQKQLQKKSDQALKHKLEKQEFKENMNNLIGELNSTATLLQKRQEDNLNLQAENEQLKSRIQQYQQAQKSLLQEVKKIKQQAEFNEKQFKSLLQDRNESFLKIQKIKNVEIQKLQRTIQQLQVKVQTEITEVLHARRDYQKLQQQCNQIESQLQETKVSYHLVNQNYHKVQQQSVLKIHQLQQTNQLLQRNLIEIAQQLKNTQMEMHQTHIMKDSLTKQLQALSKIKGDITTQQIQFIERQKKYSQIIQEQTQKLEELTQNYNNIYTQVSSVQKQNQELQYKIISNQNQLEDTREKLNKKYDQINLIKNQKFELEMTIKQLKLDIQDLQQSKQQINQENVQLQEEIYLLHQEIQNLNNINKDGALSKSRVDASYLGKSRLQSANNLAVSSNMGISSSNLGKSKQPKLRPPPKTNLFTSSNLAHQQMQFSKISKNSRALPNQINIPSINQLQKSKVSSRKIPSQQNRQNIYIDQTVSLRGTEIKNNLESNTGRNISNNNENYGNESLQVQQNGPNRMRIWTVNESIQDYKMGHSKNPSKRNMDTSQINVDVYQESQQLSEQDPNLDSEMSVREPQKFPTLSNKQIMINTRGIKRFDSIQVDANDHFPKHPLQQQCQSLTSNAMIEQYLKQIQNLKEENQKLFDEKEEVILENVQLKEKINVLTGNVQESQRKNLLATAFGLTGGLLSKNSMGQRGSVESNQQNPGIPVINLKSQKSALSPQIGSKQTIRIEDGKDLIGSMISRSKRSINDSPSRSPRESRNVTSNVNFARSSVQRPKSSRRQSLQNQYNEQQQKMRELQLLVDQLQEQNKQLKGALQQQHVSNQRLMQQMMMIQQQHQQAQHIIKQKQQQTSQVTRYYQSIKQGLQRKIQQLVQDQINKQTQQMKLMSTFQVKNQEIVLLNGRIQQLERQLSVLSNKYKGLQKSKLLGYVEYRKYQEQSQLQILRLRQELTTKGQNNTNKQSQLQLLAQDYFQLQAQHQQSLKLTKQHQQTIKSKQQQLQQLQLMYNELILQSKKYQQQRKSFNSKIHSLETDIITHQHTLETINRSTTMNIKKYQIQLQTMTEQKQHINNKLSQKQSIIHSFKHQIALYNQQTIKLQQLNTELTLQLQRTQKQLKQIMKSYQLQFTNLKQDLNSTQSSTQQFKLLLKQKDEQLTHLTRLYRKAQQQTRQANDSQHQTKQIFERYKSSKNTEINNLMNQIEINHNQFLKINTLHQNYLKQSTNKQIELNKKISLLQETKLNYKQKLLKYQNLLEELQNQLNLLSQRPTKEVFDQLQFQNDLYKNRIEELQQMISQYAPSNHAQKLKNSQDNMQLEFKKYKLQKQRQLDDLSNQIDKYSGKINQLQQGNFMLKKQIQKLKQDIKQLFGKNQSLNQQNQDLKQDITELKEEIQFYKGKRIENLSKLLNQTM